MGSITLTNLPHFVEQPGRNLTKTLGELDRMTVPFLGPWNKPVPFQEYSPDTTYPLMFCTGYNEADNGGLHQVNVNYAGIAVTSGTIPYKTQPIIEMTPIQGSRDFEVEWSAMTNTGYLPDVSYTGGVFHITGYTPVFFYSVGTQRMNVRYIGTSVVLRYQAIPRPEFDKPFYQNIGLPLVEFEILSSYAGEVSIAASGIPTVQVSAVLSHILAPPLPPPLYAAYLGMHITQVGKWFNVEETYGPTF